MINANIFSLASSFETETPAEICSCSLILWTAREISIGNSLLFYCIDWNSRIPSYKRKTLRNFSTKSKSQVLVRDSGISVKVSLVAWINYKRQEKQCKFASGKDKKGGGGGEREREREREKERERGTRPCSRSM